MRPELRKTDRGWRAWIARVVLAIGATALLLASPGSTAAHTSPEPIRLVRASSDEVVIEFTLPEYALRPVSEQGETYLQVSAEGFALLGEPGAPQLLQIGAMIGLPPLGALSWRILEVEQSTLSLSNPIYPVPLPTVSRAAAEPKSGGDNVASMPVGLSYEFALDQTLYAAGALYPADAIDVEEMGKTRGYRVARVAFYPLRSNPARGELLVTRRLVVGISFEHAEDAALLAGPGPGSAAFEGLLGKALLNYEAAREWRVAFPARTDAVSMDVPASVAGSFKIVIDAPGLYRLTYADLKDAGVPVDDIGPGTLQLFEGDQEVAILVHGQGDSSFDSSDSLVFYGRVPRSRYREQNVYWLRYGDAVGLRMDTRDVAPGGQPSAPVWTTARYEGNHLYIEKRPNADGDHWYDARLLPLAGHDRTVSLSLKPLDVNVATAALRVAMVGDTPTHRATFAVNGQPVGELSWSGRSPVTASVVVARSLLRAGDNSVRIAANVRDEGILLDAVEIDYAFQSVIGGEAFFWGEGGSHSYALGGFGDPDVSLYDVTDPRQPVHLSGATGGGGAPLSFADDVSPAATYLAVAGAQVRRPADIVADNPSNWRDPANGADYLIITHADFSDAVQPLADHRQGQGHQVAVADVQDVYDEFSGGLLDPEAIRSFIGYAYAQWTPAPTYVLLVGDGSYDFLDHFGYGSKNYIPPYLGMVDRYLGETASDNRYAAVDGDDVLPDVLLGRLPVTSAAEARTVVGKILDYERDPEPGTWNTRHIFVADNADSADDFSQSSDVVYNHYVTAPRTGRRIYLDDLSPNEAQSSALAAWQSGGVLLSFVGHSSWHQWAVENIFDFYDVPGLRNERRWPVVLSITCFTGYFHHPEYGTLDESLLRLDGGGAVATWSPSGLGIATGHGYLHTGFYSAVFDEGIVELGPATWSAKLHLYSQAPVYDDLLDTYHLFGDPAMALNLTYRPWPHSLYLPFIGRARSGR